MDNNKELIRLGIALDYAVNWDEDRIFRDLIQNFYDSIGWKDFSEEFQIISEEQEDGYFRAIMETYGRSFSYEWLTHMGGSTKAESPGKYVGMYGEGFKICALCLMRKGITVLMESSDWKIRSCIYLEKIENRNISMLGYMLEKRNDDGFTRLTLPDLNAYQIKRVEEAKLNFFYPENPLLGRKIIQRDRCAVYLRSSRQIPCRTAWCFQGILFCNGLARGRFEENIVIQICCDMRADDRRNRETYDDCQTRDFLNRKSYLLDPKTSYLLLNCLEHKWNDMPYCTPDFETYYYLICQLVRNAASDEIIRKKFMKKHSRLAYIDRKKSDSEQNRSIDDAKKWASSNPFYKSYRFVNPIFRYLGARSVLQDFEKANIKDHGQMNERERNLCEIIEQCFEDIFPVRLCQERPEIHLDNECPNEGMYYCERHYAKNGKGRRYKITKIVINREKFLNESFDRALVCYSENMLHVYGKDRSSKYNGAFTWLGEVLVDNSEIIRDYRERWNNNNNSSENDANKEVHSA